MKKIGIITYNRSYNYGARLQAYAMCEMFKDNGYDVILFDVDYPKRYFKYFFGRLINYDSYILERLQKYIIAVKMRKFNKKLPRSKHIITSSTTKMIDYINSFNLDAVVCGSDEIWSSRTKEIAPPSVYFLPKEIDCKRIALAPSCNGNHIFSGTEITWLKETFKGYSLICVRDSMTYEFVKDKVGFSNTRLVCDPTLVIDFKWKQLKHLSSSNKRKICFILARPYRDVPKQIIKALGHANYEYYSVFNKCANSTFLTLTPEEFTNIGESMDLIITNLFHGTIFALKTECNVIALDTFEKYKKAKSKVLDLVERLGCSEIYVNIYSDPNANAKILQLCHDYLQEGKKISVKDAIENEKSNFIKYMEIIRDLLNE